MARLVPSSSTRPRVCLLGGDEVVGCVTACGQLAGLLSSGVIVFMGIDGSSLISM